MKYLSPALVEQTIKSTRGTVFSVVFDDHDGLGPRSINARLRDGPKPTYLMEMTHPDLIVVFDMTNRKYSYINKTRVREIKANRKTLKVSTPL